MRLPKFIIAFWIAYCLGSSQTLAEDEFKAGMAAEAKGDARDALDHLRQAVALDPKMTKAHFAIGSVAEVWCGVDDGDLQCEVAIHGYEMVVGIEPGREDAWKRLAYATYNLNRTDQAESSYRRALFLDANDPDVLGGLAVFDTHAAYRGVYLAKIDHKLSTARELIDAPVCEEIRMKYLATLDEGIKYATKAREIKTRNADLMGVLGVLYETRAQIQCGDPRSFREDMNSSRRWNHLRAKTPVSADQHLHYMPPGPPPPAPSRHWWVPPRNENKP